MPPLSQYQPGWRYKDLEVIAVIGIQQDRSQRYSVVRVRHIPCGATKDMSIKAVSGWMSYAKKTTESRARSWCGCPPPCRRQRDREWYAKNKMTIDHAATWARRKAHPDYPKRQAAKNRRQRERTKTPEGRMRVAAHQRRARQRLQCRLADNLRCRIYKAMRGFRRGVSAVRDLGCTIDMFRQHIERQFVPGMSWSNYGQWHLDHKRPLASFDLSDVQQQRQACHYTNYQPLWASDNRQKWDTYDLGAES